MENNGAVAWQETDAGRKLQVQLSDHDTLTGLGRLLNRVDELEKTVDRLNGVLESFPSTVSIMTDVADETYRKAAEDGIDIEARLRNGLAIAEKLTHPATTEKIDLLLQMTDRLPGMVSMVTDMTDEALRKLKDNGIELEKRVSAALHLADRLTAPETVERIEGALDFAQRSEGMVAMTMDIVDEGMREANQRGLDPVSLMQKGVRAAADLSNVLESDEFKELQSSGLMDKSAIAVVGAMGKAMVAAQRNPGKPVGLFGAMRAMRDPEVQRALGFLIGFAREFGKNLS